MTNDSAKPQPTAARLGFWLLIPCYMGAALLLLSSLDLMKDATSLGLFDSLATVVKMGIFIATLSALAASKQFRNWQWLLIFTIVLAPLGVTGEIAYS